jgi:hypothetical protein
VANETDSMNDSGAVRTVTDRQHPDGTPYTHVHTIDDSHPAPRWRANVRVDKRDGDWTDEQILAGEAPLPYEVVEAEHNLLLTAGATALWNGLSTAGLALPFNTTNCQLVVGDASTAPAVGNTDMAAALATKMNAADATAATNATPIVVTATFSPTPVVGEVYAISGFSGAGAAAINQTFELSVASASSVTLLNSAGSGAITLAGGVLQKVNKYAQRANAAGSAVVSGATLTFVATFGTSNANFTNGWLEWGVRIGAQVTNMQAAPPTTLLNRATPGGGLGVKTSASSWTLSIVLSLA